MLRARAKSATPPRRTRRGRWCWSELGRIRIMVTQFDFPGMAEFERSIRRLPTEELRMQVRLLRQHPEPVTTWGRIRFRIAVDELLRRQREAVWGA